MPTYETTIHQITAPFQSGSIYTVVQSIIEGLPSLEVVEEMMANVSLLPYWQQQVGQITHPWAEATLHLSRCMPPWESTVSLTFSGSGYVLSCIKKGSAPWMVTIDFLLGLPEADIFRIMTGIKQRLSSTEQALSIDCVVSVWGHEPGQSGCDGAWIALRETHVPIACLVSEGEHFYVPFERVKSID